METSAGLPAFANADPAGTGSSGGCNSGFGFAPAICGAALLLAPKRRK